MESLYKKQPQSHLDEEDPRHTPSLLQSLDDSYALLARGVGRTDSGVYHRAHGLPMRLRLTDLCEGEARRSDQFEV